MKDKPLGFQIWLIVSFALIMTTLIVATITYIAIDQIQPINIKVLDFFFLGCLFKLILCIVIVGIIVAKVISNIVTEPIRFLERRVRLIAEKKWTKDIEIDRKDEIGKLTYSIRKMQDDLERLDKEEDAFLQSLSHELKTPIMVIKNYCQALRDQVYIHNSLEATIQVIENEADLLSMRCSKLLYATSLEYVLEKEKKLEPVNIQKLINELLERVVTPIQKPYNLQVELIDVQFLGIEEKISIAIENILDNAIRYAQNYIRIQTKLEFDLYYKETQWLCLTIANDGEDISADVKEHLFDKFYKGANGCFGLGLYISQKIIEFHKGNISIDSKCGEVEFTIRIPITV